LGDRSYALYLLHIPLFAVLGVVWRKVSGPGYLDNVVAFAIMISAALICADLFYRYIEQPLLRLRLLPLRAKPA
ncbi:MAG: hypothetical protein ABWZ40_14690, partial [Caulobacterales bacterium]